jgi:hypothetical protein
LENLGVACSCYHAKVKSTPRILLGWEFDNNKGKIFYFIFILCRDDKFVHIHSVPPFSLKINLVFRM